MGPDCQPAAQLDSTPESSSSLFESHSEAVQYRGYLEGEVRSNSAKREVDLARSDQVAASYILRACPYLTLAKPETCHDIDIFMVVDDGFDVGSLERETAFLFDHPAAQSYFGASVFWIRRLAALGGETAAVEHWQLKRDGNLRGIVEVLQ